MRHRGTTVTNKLDRQTWPTTPSQTTHHTATAFRPLTMKPPEYIKPPLSPTSDHFCLTKFHQPVNLVDTCITTPYLRQNISYIPLRGHRDPLVPPVPRSSTDGQPSCAIGKAAESSTPRTQTSFIARGENPSGAARWPWRGGVDKRMKNRERRKSLGRS